MFKQRLLTALVLVPLVLLAIFYGPSWLIGFIVLLLVAGGGWEWLQLIPISRNVEKWLFMLVLLFAVWLGLRYSSVNLVMGLLLWVGILFAVITFPTSQRFWGYPLWVGAACLLLLSLFVNASALIYHKPQGKALVIYLLCLVWVTDSGAYIVGKRFGHHRLIPIVSPGKTIEGLLGGIVLAMLTATIGYFYFQPCASLLWFIVALITVLMSVVGDLFISMLKRRSNIKDTGHIFPGHGGVLDRIDSWIAAFPVFCGGIMFQTNGGLGCF